MTRLKLLFVTLLGIFIMLSFSSNPPQGRTGGGGERTCASAGCHSSNTAAFDGHIELRGLPQTFSKDESYSLNLDMIVDRGTPIRGGFQMMALTSEGENIDAFENAGVSSTISSLGERKYFEHDPALRFEGRDTLSYQVDWTYTGTDDEVIFYAAANFANGNGGTSGDLVVVWSDTFKVMSAAQLSAAIEFQNLNCSTNTNGSAEVIVQGGQAPFQYVWSTGDTTKIIEDIGAGIYSVTVIDAEEAQAFAEASLSASLDAEPPVLFCLADTVVIRSCDFFNYPTPTATDNCGDAEVRLISGLGTNRSFPIGITYEVYEASDDQGNTSQCTIVINNIVDLTASVKAVHLACHFDSVGSVIVESSGDNPPFLVTTLSEGLTPDSLTEGTHTISIADDTGCQIIEDIEIRRPDSIIVEIAQIIKPRNSTSGDGAIDIEADGGSPPFSYVWRTEDEEFSRDEDLSLLFPGTYTYIVTDSRGCEAVRDSITLDAITFVADVKISTAISLYPNPAVDQINLDIDIETSSVSSIEIFNINGKRESKINGYVTVIDVNELTSGTYLMVLKTKAGQFGIKTFIKQ